MKKVLVAAGLLLCVVSCKSKHEQLVEQLTPVVAKAITNDGLVNKLDSVIIYKVDTLSDLQYAQVRLQNFTRQADYYLKKAELYTKMANAATESAELDVRQVRLYSMLNADGLVQNAKDDATDDIAKSRESLKNNQLYKDSLEAVEKQMTIVDSNIKAKKYNAHNFKGYVAHFRVLGTDKKNVEIRKNALTMWISPAYRTIDMRTIE